MTPEARAGGGTGASNDKREGHGIGNACRAWVGGIGMDAASWARVQVEAGVAHSFSQSSEASTRRGHPDSCGRPVYPADSLHHAAKCPIGIEDVFKHSHGGQTWLQVSGPGSQLRWRCQQHHWSKHGDWLRGQDTLAHHIGSHTRTKHVQKDRYGPAALRVDNGHSTAP